MKMTSWKENNSKIEHSKYTNLRNTLFIFTSNVGEHTIAASKSRSIGFTPSNSRDGEYEVFLQELKRYFKPEFIGRMDAQVRCHHLDQEQLRKVFDLHTARMNKILAEKNYFASFRVATTRNYVDAVLSWARSIEYWARAIAPAIKEMGALAGLALAIGADTVVVLVEVKPVKVWPVFNSIV
jgi:ATP-dependent Clp protease ATP-binding subunit ClpA